MTTLPVKEDEQLILVSHSNDSTFEYCARLFEFVSVHKKIPPYEAREPEAMALRVGSIMHEAAQEWFRARHEGHPNPVDAALYRLALDWDYEREDAMRPLGAAATLIMKMAADPYWRDWELCEIDGFGPAIEVPFRIMHDSIDMPPGYRIATQGKIDIILRNIHTGQVKPHDFKTTTQPSRIWYNLFRFSDQIAFYGFPVQAVTGVPVGSRMETAYYMLSFGRERTFDSPEAEFNGEISQDHLRVQVLDVVHEAEELTEMMQIKGDRLRDIARYLRNDMFPRRTHGCVIYNRPCTFFNMCHIRDRAKLEQWFSFEEWEDHDRIYEPVWTFTS